MVTGTYARVSLNIPIEVSDHERKLLTILDDIISHGFGDITIRVTETKNFKTKILILAGRSWAYFIDKEIKMLDQKHIL